jgi:hypothetical protein
MPALSHRNLAKLLPRGMGPSQLVRAAVGVRVTSQLQRADAEWRGRQQAGGGAGKG